MPLVSATRCDLNEWTVMAFAYAVSSSTFALRGGVRKGKKRIHQVFVFQSFFLFLLRIRYCSQFDKPISLNAFHSSAWHHSISLHACDNVNHLFIVLILSHYFPRRCFNVRTDEMQRKRVDAYRTHFLLSSPAWVLPSVTTMALRLFDSIFLNMCTAYFALFCSTQCFLLSRHSDLVIISSFFSICLRFLIISSSSKRLQSLLTRLTVSSLSFLSSLLSLFAPYRFPLLFSIHRCWYLLPHLFIKLNQSKFLSRILHILVHRHLLWLVAQRMK